MIDIVVNGLVLRGFDFSEDQAAKLVVALCQEKASRNGTRVEDGEARVPSTYKTEAGMTIEHVLLDTQYRDETVNDIWKFFRQHGGEEAGVEGV